MSPADIPLIKRRDVAIVIPVYKPAMSVFEQISLRQCLRVLARYPITLIAPEGLDLESYYRFDPAGPQLGEERLDPAYFAGIDGYNRLMLSRDFYQRFTKFRYLLIYQLDAFVFRDELLDWCDMGYDYVGAPWIDSLWAKHWSRHATTLRRRVPWARRLLNSQVGNGGLSLRNVHSTIRALTLFAGAARSWPTNEDYFFAFYPTSYQPGYRVPTMKKALRFSFDESPRQCFELAERTLPFGCHAWQRYDIDFWRPHFAELGYTI